MEAMGATRHKATRGPKCNDINVVRKVGSGGIVQQWGASARRLVRVPVGAVTYASGLRMHMMQLNQLRRGGNERVNGVSSASIWRHDYDSTFA